VAVKILLRIVCRPDPPPLDVTTGKNRKPPGNRRKNSSGSDLLLPVRPLLVPRSPTASPRHLGQRSYQRAMISRLASSILRDPGSFSTFIDPRGAKHVVTYLSVDLSAARPWVNLYVIPTTGTTGTTARDAESSLACDEDCSLTRGSSLPRSDNPKSGIVRTIGSIRFSRAGRRKGGLTVATENPSDDRLSATRRSLTAAASATASFIGEGRRVKGEKSEKYQQSGANC